MAPNTSSFGKTQLTLRAGFFIAKFYTAAGDPFIAKS
jgi:hypothetical protein